MRAFVLSAAALASAASLTVCAAAPAPQPLTVPDTVRLPDLQPLVPDCADPAVDRFLELDLSQRPPAGSQILPRIRAYVTSDGVFHWPFVARLRNLGDKPFVGPKGNQMVVVRMDDLRTGAKNQEILAVPFDRIEAHRGLAVRFEFTAPAEAIRTQRFHRVYTIAIKYARMGFAVLNSPNGDCDLMNNSFRLEFDGSRKGWIFGK